MQYLRRRLLRRGKTLTVADLKSCPFCGSTAESVSTVCDYGIFCPVCGLILIETGTDILTEKWNRRAVL
jgi:hypothetical protein